ncbi:putative peptidoglycan binding protein [Motilibacter peucedani]|uniref:Putative peptidoglycan binding protein n=1 Tax=Motilibacter peucedani TaxID=598650 RepID=A0A420XRT3_9ACTN|nr:transglycosylase family protein [Motilibacter peucedani]RKS77574.1 putative peptidoglycan binding protein [Motilibacter peucedani]
MTLSRTLRPYAGRHRRPAPPSAAVPRAAVAIAGLGVTGAAFTATATSASAAPASTNASGSSSHGRTVAHRTPVLVFGAHGPAVRSLQARLGLDAVNGRFGVQTRAAVRAFQTRHGLHSTGVVDKLTWRALPAAKAISKPVAATKATTSRTKASTTRTKVSSKRVSRSDARVSDSVEGLNWSALARCEAGGNPRAYNAAGYYGLYQFSIGTWHGVGGSGTPSSASAEEQTYRAQLLYARRGSSPWPTCGRLLYS